MIVEDHPGTIDSLPAILNAKSMKPFADKVVSTVPNGEIYSYVSSSMMRFFIINFYDSAKLRNRYFNNVTNILLFNLHSAVFC